MWNVGRNRKKKNIIHLNMRGEKYEKDYFDSTGVSYST